MFLRSRASSARADIATKFSEHLATGAALFSCRTLDDMSLALKDGHQ